MVGLYQCVEEAVQALRDLTEAAPEVALILGTGLGGVARRVAVTKRVPYEGIPHFGEATVEGHKGDLVFGTLGGYNMVVMEGRLHYYEGYSLQQTTLPVRVFRRLGADILIIISAAGGLNPLFRPGDIVAVRDHINMMGENPLRGITDERLGNRFPDMSRPYDEQLILMASEVALDLKIPLKHGVYVAVAGPSLETRTETRMLRMLGADAVGMSTVPEVIVAAQVGFRTLALAAVTNVNLPDAMEPISIDGVIAAAMSAESRLADMVESVLHLMKQKQAGSL